MKIAIIISILLTVVLPSFVEAQLTKDDCTDLNSLKKRLTHLGKKLQCSKSKES